MKKLLTIIMALLPMAAGLFAQNYKVFEEIAAVPERTNGYYWIQDFEHGPLTAAPEGYKPFYIGTYARHGARYAWQDTYLILDTLLHRAADCGRLTAYGQDFLERLDRLVPLTRGRLGELTPIGWEQHRKVARNLMDDFPEVFEANPSVLAMSSPVGRCIMSMSSECVEIARRYPQLDIYEDLSYTNLPEVVPTNTHNPTPVKYGRIEKPFKEKYRTLDPDMLAARLITDPKSYFTGHYRSSDLVYAVYTLATLMDGVDIDIRFDDFFVSQDEKTLYWMEHSLREFNSAYSKQYREFDVARSFVDRADECITEGGAGVTLRFGHDSVIMPLIILLNVGGRGHVADKPEEQLYWFRLYDICMAAHFVTVLYRGPEGSPILFKALLNGEETTLPDLTPVDGPYYRWDDFRSYVLDTIGARAAEVYCSSGASDPED